MDLQPDWTKDPKCGCDSDLDPDPDIAGLGVLVAFVVTSLIALIFSNIFLTSRLAESANPIDSSIGRVLRRIWKWPFRRPWIFETALLSAARSFGDTQMVTSVAVIITALFRLNSGITIYHFSIVTDFAWIACSSQIMVLYAVAVKNDHKRVKMSSSILGCLRAILLVSQLGLLSFALVIRFNDFVFDDDEHWYKCRADCLIRRRYESGVGPIAWFFVIWTLGGMTRSLGLTRFITEQLKKLGSLFLQKMGIEDSFGRFEMHRAVSRRLRDSWKNFLGQRFCHPTPWQYAKSAICVWCKTFATVLFLFGWLIFILFNSNMISMMLAAFWYFLGIGFLFVDRDWSAQYFIDNGKINTESSWGFGQVLSLVILLIPNLALTATYADILENSPHGWDPSPSPESKSEGGDHLPVLASPPPV